MEPPTPDELRARSALLTEKFPPASPDPLQPYLDDVIALVSSITARILTNDATSCVEVLVPCEETPEGLRPLALRALTLMAERMGVRGELKIARLHARGQFLRGFTAGRYSEQYFSPGELSGTKGVTRPRVDPDPELDALLWALMTEAMREQFIGEATGVWAPASTTTQVNWADWPGGY